MAKYQLFNNMNSPQPLSVSLRGAKRCTPPSFACKRELDKVKINENPTMEYKLEICVDNIESAINAQNAGATEFNLTGRKTIDSEMTFRRQNISMDSTSDIPESSRKVFDPDMIRSIINKLKLI